MNRKTSLQKKLIIIFLWTSIIPIILLVIFIFYRTLSTLKKNTDVLMQTNLVQLDNNMEIWLDSYKDVLYQLYTDDNVVSSVDKLNEGQDVAVTVNQLRRTLRAMLNTKEYIRSITIITDSGLLVKYDQLAPTTYAVPFWIENYSLPQKDIYEMVSEDNQYHILSTEYATTFANDDFYLMHLAHRIIDYKNIDKHNGIVILSIDETLLRRIFEQGEEGEFISNSILLVDNKGNIVSSDRKEEIGVKIVEAGLTEEQRLEAYKKYIIKSERFNEKYTSLFLRHNDATDWDILYVADQSSFINEMNQNIYIILFVCVILLILTIVLIWGLSRRLVDSVNQVVESMKLAGKGDLEIHVPVNEKMPREIETIALQFNGTLEKLKYASKKEKEANEKQLQAEIKALEAQINPHFLYNTLDTINWMAIDKDEFDISNAINSLAIILRYAITNSSGIVTVHEELEWLKKYIYLQQFRLKNKFSFNIDAPIEVMDCKIHKLLLQPFIENAIIHGFADIQRDCILEVALSIQGDSLKLVVRDNGKGIDPEICNKIREGIPVGGIDKDHMGLDNILTRLQMYYGGNEKLSVKSEPGAGTEFVLYIPCEI